MAAPRPRRDIRATLVVLLPGLFLTALDQTIIATSIRTIADDLGGFADQAWIGTAYLVAATVATPLYGRLADRWGRRPLYLAALALFVTGSAACAFAGSVPVLAVCRAVQGLGAGGVLALCLVLVADLVPPRERARYQGYLVGAYGLAAVAGPVLGGWFAAQQSLLGIAGWRWVFLLGIPIGLATAVAAHRRIAPRARAAGGPIDWAGAALLPVGLVPLLVLADRGHGWGWTSAGSLACLALGAAGLTAFLAAQLRAGRHALLPLRMFADRAVAPWVLAGVVVGFVMFGAVALIPQYAQIVAGASPVVAGLYLVPAVGGAMAGSVLCSRYIRAAGRFRPPALAGALLLAAGSAVIARTGADASPALLAGVLLGIGVGLGALTQPITLAVQAARDAGELGSATAASTFFRQVGGTAGISVFVAVLFARLPGEVRAELTAAAAADPAFLPAVRAAADSPDPEVAALARDLVAGRSDGAAVLADSSVIARLEAPLAGPLRAAFADGFTAGAPIAFGLALVALVAIALVREVPASPRSDEQRASGEQRRESVRHRSDDRHA